MDKTCLIRRLAMLCGIGSGDGNSPWSDQKHNGPSYSVAEHQNLGWYTSQVVVVVVMVGL